jgi:hypothetical protein
LSRHKYTSILDYALDIQIEWPFTYTLEFTMIRAPDFEGIPNTSHNQKFRIFFYFWIPFRG